MQNIGGVVGVGIDLVDIARIRKLLENYPDSFVERTFTPTEIAYCKRAAEPALHFAARFAAKEAMVKALQTGFAEQITLKSVSVENNPQTHAPVAVLDAHATEQMQKLGGKKMLISLTHLKDYAQAIAIITK